MPRKKLTEEQESEIKMLLANNEMLEKTKKEAEERGKTKSVAQIKAAQDEVIEHIKSIDPDAVSGTPTFTQYTKKVIKQDDLFNDDLSIVDILKDDLESRKELEAAKPNELVQKKSDDLVDIDDTDNIIPSETTTVDDKSFNNVDPSAAYDIIQLPSNGQPYRSKIDRIPVAYLTAYDENMITSPNLYKDGLVIDFLLKNKIMNDAINVDDLVSGDADAIILFLRATSYGPEFPIVVNDPDTGEQIETIVDLTTLKPREFKLVGDENGHFEYTTPLKKDKIKFRYLTRKQERKLRQITELEAYGTKAHLLDRERETLAGVLVDDKYLEEGDKKNIRAAIKSMQTWSKKLHEVNNSEFTKVMTNNLMMQIVSVNGETDREFIRKYVYRMPARDSLMLRRYIMDNRPGIDFDIEVERPESLGGGSFKTFLNWDDSVFLNIADV